jgi:hypothetical protein
MMFQRQFLQKYASNVTRNKYHSLVPEQWLRIVVGSLNHTAAMPQHQQHFISKKMMMSTLTDAEQQYFKEGIMDERGLVQFDTLHNMQVRSCRVYADKDLFATYSTTTQNFEWMTFAECKSCLLYLRGEKFLVVY